MAAKACFLPHKQMNALAMDAIVAATND